MFLFVGFYAKRRYSLAERGIPQAVCELAAPSLCPMRAYVRCALRASLCCVRMAAELVRPRSHQNKKTASKEVVFLLDVGESASLYEVSRGKTVSRGFELPCRIALLASGAILLHGVAKTKNGFQRSRIKQKGSGFEMNLSFFVGESVSER